LRIHHVRGSVGRYARKNGRVRGSGWSITVIPLYTLTPSIPMA
jgi:hypothetical protein